MFQLWIHKQVGPEDNEWDIEDSFTSLKETLIQAQVWIKNDFLVAVTKETKNETTQIYP